MFVASRQS
jgi:NAD(P)-dependent dehydrogenase (short-subunit alcohol dehydrogenase family)